MKSKKGLFALIVICVLWGTTYLAIRIAVKSFSPLLFSGMRMFLAGIILLAIVLIRRDRVNWTMRNLLKQSAIGFTLFCTGTALLGWSEVFIPSGLAALIVSLVPLNIVLINQIINKKIVINAYIITGILSGLIGMMIMFKDNLKDLEVRGNAAGIFLCLASTIFWSLGTVFSKKYNSNNNTSYHNSALQFLTSGIVLLVIGVCIEDKEVILSAGFDSWLALGYLIIFGSIIGFMCYQYAIKTIALSTVALYAYINPVIAIILGCIFLKEKFTISIGVAFIFIAAGIYLVNAGNYVSKSKC